MARCATDNAWFCYVADLMVHKEFQGLGLGRALLREVHNAAGGPEDVTLILEAAPGVEGFYEKVGMKRSERGFLLPRTGNPPHSG